MRLLSPSPDFYFKTVEKLFLHNSHILGGQYIKYTLQELGWTPFLPFELL